MEIFDGKLETLMLNKAFEDLTDKERVYVLAHLSETTYDNYRLTLISTVEVLKESGKNLVPDVAIRERLKVNFQEKFKPAKAPLLTNFSRYSTLYRASFGVAAIVIVLIWVNKPKEIMLLKKNNIAVVHTAPIKNEDEPIEIKQVAQVAVQRKSKSTQKKRLAHQVENDTTLSKNEEPLGLYVYQPLLCADIHVNPNIPGLNEQITTN